MSDYNNVKVDLTNDELLVVMSALYLTMKSFEKFMDERGHNNMRLDDQFTYVEVKNLHKKLKDKYF